MTAYYPSKREQVIIDETWRSPVVATECSAVAQQVLAATDS